MDARVKGPGPNAEQQAVLDDASRKLRRALDEAMAMPPEEGLEVRYDGMRYVEDQHNWGKISERYGPPIAAALKAAAERAPRFFYVG
jgi:hypothetical protein